MANEEDIIKKIIDKLDGAVNDFNTSIPGIQKDIAGAIENLLRGLDIKGDTVKASVSNMKQIATFEDKVNGILRQSNYPDNVKDFILAFNEVAELQHEYFKAIQEEFKPMPLLDEIKKQNIGTTLESLTESGLNANLIYPVKNLLLNNISTGGSFQQMAQQMRDFIVSGKSGDGALERYVKQTTVDSINTFSGQYMNAITNDLRLGWFMYLGPLIKTSRAWCLACHKKKYLHRSEFQDLIDGDFPEFEEFDGEIYDKTGLPSGMKAGTNPSNLQVRRGGWGCNHQMFPVTDGMVPDSVKSQIPYITTYLNNKGGKVLIHQQAHGKDLPENKRVANILADKFNDTVHVLRYKEDRKNPDLKINGNIADLKTPDPTLYKNIWRPISEGIQRAEEQGAVHTIIQLSSNYDLKGIINGIRHGFKNADSMQYVDIIYPNKSVIRITRAEYENGDYSGIIKNGHIEDK